MVKFGNFAPNLTNYRKEGKYWIGNNSLYCKTRHKLSFWKIWIQNLDKPKTTIHFYGDPFFSKELFFVLLLEPFLTYKFSQKGILFLHSSAFSFNGKGVIVSGETGTGKTTMLLNLLKEPSTEYYADDQAIVKNSTLYSYPMSIGLRTHLVRHCKLKLSSKDNLYILFHNLVNVVTNYYGNLTHRVHPEDILFKNSEKFTFTGNKVDIKYVFLLSLGGKPKVTLLTPKEAKTKLLWHNRGNEDKQQIIYRYFTAFKKVYPELNYWSDYGKLLSKFVQSDVLFYNVQLSKKYRFGENIEKILKILETEKC